MSNMEKRYRNKIIIIIIIISSGTTAHGSGQTGKGAEGAWPSECIRLWPEIPHGGTQTARLDFIGHNRQPYVTLHHEMSRNVPSLLLQ